MRREHVVSTLDESFQDVELAGLTLQGPVVRAHGADQQQNAVKSGYWPLFRYNPLNAKGQRFMLDCKEPSLPLKEFLYNETRFSSLTRTNPSHAEELLVSAEQGIHNHWERLLALKNL